MGDPDKAEFTEAFAEMIEGLIDSDRPSSLIRIGVGSSLRDMLSAYLDVEKEARSLMESLGEDSRCRPLKEALERSAHVYEDLSVEYFDG